MERKIKLKELEEEIVNIELNDFQEEEFAKYLEMKETTRGRNKTEKLIYKLEQILGYYPKPNETQSYYKRNRLLYLNRAKKGTEFYEKIKEDIKSTPATIKIRRGRFNFHGEEIDENGKPLKKVNPKGVKGDKSP